MNITKLLNKVYFAPRLKEIELYTEHAGELQAALQNLNRSPPAVAERKHAARIGIKFEFQLDNCSQSVIAFSQIGSSTGKVNGCATCQIKHDLSVPV